jgi:rRNA-processing protein FCF1
MKKILLDTNFILICIKQKIDFFEELKLRGFKIIIPENVIREIKKIKKSRQKQRHREIADLALKILNKSSFEKIKFEKRNLDNAIAEFANKNENITVATLDRELKKKIKKPKLIIRGKKKLEII